MTPRRFVLAACPVLFAGLFALTACSTTTPATPPTAATGSSVVTGQTELPFTGLKNPGSVAVDAEGDVYVADRGNNGVLKLVAG